MASNGTPKDKSKNKGDVDLNHSARGVWLVKVNPLNISLIILYQTSFHQVPKYISDRWEKADPNTEVGKLKIKKIAGAKPEVNFTLSDSVCAPLAGLSETDQLELIRNSSTAKEIPKQHKFKISSIAAQTLGVFSCSSGPDGDRLSMEGKVVQRAECCPISDTLYSDIKKDAISKAGEPRRKVIKMDRHVNTHKPVAHHASSLADLKKKKEEGKKMRDDKEKVQEIIFALFEKHQYYNIKDLIRETRQPVQYLKEILNEICVYSMKPPHRNMWELKPEYRHYQAPEEDETKKKKNESDSDSD